MKFRSYRYAESSVSIKSNGSVDAGIFSNPEIPERSLFIFIKVECLKIHIFSLPGTSPRIQQTFRRRIQSGRFFVFPQTRFCSFLKHLRLGTLAGTSLALPRDVSTNSDLCRVISISGTRGLIGMRRV